jgi:hypothetical protein
VTWLGIWEKITPYFATFYERLLCFYRASLLDDKSSRFKARSEVT